MTVEDYHDAVVQGMVLADDAASPTYGESIGSADE